MLNAVYWSDFKKRITDVYKRQMVRLDTGEKVTVPLDKLESQAKQFLEEIQNNLYEMALKNLNENTFTATTVEETKEIANKKGGFVKAMWCGDLDCELTMKERAGVSSRCIPFKQEHISDVCPVCGKPAKHMVVWGIAY